MEQSSGRLPDDMVEWIESATLATVTNAVRQAGGGRKEAWLIELSAPSGAAQRLFLRWDRSAGASTGDPWTVRREAAVYAALGGTGVPIAALVAVHPVAEAMLLSVITGENWFSRITDPARAIAVASDFIRHLATLHRLDVGTLGLGVDSTASVPDLVRAQLAEMSNMISVRGGTPDAALGLAMRWLSANVPDYAGPAVLVQGDTGPGNFMYEGDHVTAIVDWELAHVGDPMDDLAWVSLRAVQEPFTDLATRLAEYEQLSGHRVDIARILYYRVLAEAKIMVMSHGSRQAASSGGPDGGGDPGARLIFGQLHRRLLLEALAEVMGVELDEPDRIPSADAGERDALYGVVLDQLRTVVAPRITDGFAVQRLKGLARVVKYLEAAAGSGRACDEAERADLEAVLGAPVVDVAAGRALLASAVCDGAVEPVSALRVLYRRAARDNELMRAASGVLADRHYDPLEPFRAARG